MLTQRDAACLLRSASVGAWFAAAQIGLIFSVAPGVSAATPRVLFESAAHSQTPQTLAVPADSPRWDLQGQAKATEYQGRQRLFLNGRILFRGRSAQYFRDPGFLGIINPENDAVYLPLKKGRNELLLALSELGGGWGVRLPLSGLERRSSCRLPLLGALFDEQPTTRQSQFYRHTPYLRGLRKYHQAADAKRKYAGNDRLPRPFR